MESKKRRKKKVVTVWRSLLDRPRKKKNHPVVRTFKDNLWKNKPQKVTVGQLWDKRTQHPYHLVNPGPWPFCTAMSVGVLMIGIILWLQEPYHEGKVLFRGMLYLTVSLYGWTRSIVLESMEEGKHNEIVQKNIRTGMGLFIISEIMFFFVFFISFFYFSMVPGIWIGWVWPPIGIKPINPWGIPIVNTTILLFSGLTLTWAHELLLVRKEMGATNTLGGTILAGITFVLLQGFEYTIAHEAISSGIYGSLFFITTGFHGLHVIIGLVLIIICNQRNSNGHFKKGTLIGLEMTSWYWHFVDIVWLGLFIIIYWWGG